MADRKQTTCDQCGKTDDHPKWHYGIETYHHDCAPHTVIRDVTTTGFWQVVNVGRPDQRREWVPGDDIPEGDLPVQIKRGLEARKLAESGTRGEKLRARIEKIGTD